MSPPAATRSILVALLVASGACAPEGSSQPDLSSFRLHPDFRIELAAAEPVVFDPVDLAFDEAGNVFVLEMPGYPLRDESGRVVLLRDEDGDGRWEGRHIFAEDLPVAASILPYRRGLLVASPPDLLLLEDRDGDGVAETRTVLLSGFADDNTQHNFNGLTHGLDNWIYGANGGNSGEVFWPDRPEDPTPLRFDDFRVDLEAKRFERWGRSSGGFGLTFDSWGRNFATHNLFHISHLVFPGRYLAELPVGKSSRSRISDHQGDGPARIYPIGVQETRVNHPEQSGHFSGACGITAYTGGAFPAGFEDNVFVADVVLNLIHRSVVRRKGTDLVARRARPEEFLASSDRAFRPVNMTVGPSGALFVLDMHRDVIEHPDWIPDPIEENLDLKAGRGDGRIYRILPRAGLPGWPDRLDRDDPAALLDALGHPNGWHRATAQRLLVEEQATEASSALQATVATSDNPLQRLHALWTLDGLGFLDEETLIAALADERSRVREDAVLLAEVRSAQSRPLAAAVRKLARDPEPRVRLRVALSLATGSLGNSPDSIALLLDIAQRLPDDPWTRLAVVAGLQGHVVDGFHEWTDRAGLNESAGGLDLVRAMMELADEAEIVPVLVAVTADTVPGETIVAVLAGLSEALERDRGQPAEVPPATRRRLQAIGSRELDATTTEVLRITHALGLQRSPQQLTLLERAARRAVDASAFTGDRLEALRILAFADFVERRDALFGLLGSQHPQEIQLAALGQLTEENGIGKELIDRWHGLGPRVRQQATTYFLRRPAHHGLLLSALEEGCVTLGEMNLHLERRRALLWSDDADIRRRAEALFDDAGVVTRSEALAGMLPALHLEGQATDGHRLFTNLCARCHRFGEQGTEVGPDLTEISRKSPETLLHDIIDPNAAVEAEFLSYTIETTDGRLLTGLVRDQTDRGLVLQEGDGRGTEISRAEIADMRTGGLSLMPEELEAGLEPQDLADLLAFLQQGPVQQGTRW